MKYPQDTYLYKGTRVSNTWIRADDIETYSPITQVYGIIFSDKGEILICRPSATAKWQIPGGSPEKRERLEETLERELLEEVDVKVKNIKLLGYQRVDQNNNPFKHVGDRYYQARMYCELKELLPLNKERHFWPQG